jgi:dUTP pyrophosphatase
MMNDIEKKAFKALEDTVFKLSQEVAELKHDTKVNNQHIYGLERVGVWCDPSVESQLPFRAHATDAGLDVHSAESCTIKPNERKMIHTGVYLEMQENWECQVRPRSGLALKRGITVLNSPGTIDCSYRGEVCVILLNTSEEDFEIKVGDRIAQLVFSKVPSVSLYPLLEKPGETIRGDSGFGSTGGSDALECFNKALNDLDELANKISDK